MDLSDHSENSDYSNLYNEHSDIFKELKGILPQCNKKHYKDLIDP